MNVWPSLMTCLALVLVTLYPAMGQQDGANGSSASADDAVQQLAREVRDRGWILYAARSAQGDWDLFLCRPDGSSIQNITRSPDFNEFSPLFSPDAARIIYRRIARSETIDNNQHGMQGSLVLARSDGSQPTVLGGDGELTWASWSPDGKQIACLTKKGILFIEFDTRKVLKTLPRKGFFQQVTWSPDGKWLVGVANSFGEAWSIARMDVATGDATAVNKVQCCTPDWFPDSRHVIFSWRPARQDANNGYGWTQLWRASADGKSRQLVYGEDGRHVYGGSVSPDGKFVLFTGNMQEDGDPEHGGGPMGLMRLSDAPIIGGESRALRAVHPQVADGPVLILPVGWEPTWTYHELPDLRSPDGGESSLLPTSPSQVQSLSAEVRRHGWIAFSALTPRGDWDLVMMRPDGSERQTMAGSPDHHEVAPRFAPDGKHLLWYRIPAEEPVDNNTYGTYDLIISDRKGGQPAVMGRDLAWAAWGPDSEQIACLARDGIRIVDLTTREVIQRYPRHGLVSQLGWSPDGTSFCGTANGLGMFWNIGVVAADTGKIIAASEVDRYNCTGDWMPDSRHVIYARGISPPHDGRAELWRANADGSGQSPLYAEGGRHVYGACASPDGKYLLFTRSLADLGEVASSQTTMSIIRMADTPMRGDDADSLADRFSGAHTGPRLDLGPGWEPAWTLSAMEISPSDGRKKP